MAIKKLTFSWDIPLTSLLGLIASGQADMRIDVLGDDKQIPLSKLLGNPAAALLEGPKHGNRGQSPARAVDANGKKTTAISIILAALANTPGHTKTSTDLKPPLVEVGLKPNSASPQIANCQKKGWIERVDHGTYKLTDAGIEECKRRNIEVYVAPVAPPEKPDKPPSQKATPKSHAYKSKNGIGAHHG
jgi:hypothetical protein